ncbi:MAG TPA: hypothetical protein VK171_14525, partial [Fimbriimonas sp.]|nr:hypothetical protein [Fimbriimonas sp.]
MSKLISLLGAFGVTAAIAGPTYVSLQTSSPGVPESGNINVNGFVASSIARVDNSNTNTGKLTPGLLFGPTNSGEGISSARTATSPNSNGLDLYTNSTARLSITNGGNVGIGTKTPSEKLTVQGNLAVSGKVAASNMPAIKMVQGQDLYVQASQSSQTVTV